MYKARVWAAPNKQKDASGYGRKFSFYGSVNTLPMLATSPFPFVAISVYMSRTGGLVAKKVGSFRPYLFCCR